MKSCAVLIIIGLEEHNYDECRNVVNVNKCLTDPVKRAMLWMSSDRHIRQTHKTSCQTLEESLTLAYHFKAGTRTSRPLEVKWISL